MPLRSRQSPNSTSSMFTMLRCSWSAASLSTCLKVGETRRFGVSLLVSANRISAPKVSVQLRYLTEVRQPVDDMASFRNTDVSRLPLLTFRQPLITAAFGDLWSNSRYQPIAACHPCPIYYRFWPVAISGAPEPIYCIATTGWRSDQAETRKGTGPALAPEPLSPVSAGAPSHNHHSSCKHRQTLPAIFHHNFITFYF